MILASAQTEQVEHVKKTPLCFITLDDFKEQSVGLHKLSCLRDRLALSFSLPCQCCVARKPLQIAYDVLQTPDSARYLQSDKCYALAVNQDLARLPPSAFG